MVIEEKLPERFRNAAFHPSVFVYAWKRNVLDKLFEEFLASNIAVVGGEAWVAEDELFRGVIPLKDGNKAVLNWKINRQAGEEWYDFVERSAKESIGKIADTNLEKQVNASTRNHLYYHFEFGEE